MARSRTSANASPAVRPREGDGTTDYLNPKSAATQLRLRTGANHRYSLPPTRTICRLPCPQARGEATADVSKSARGREVAGEPGSPVTVTPRSYPGLHGEGDRRPGHRDRGRHPARVLGGGEPAGLPAARRRRGAATGAARRRDREGLRRRVAGEGPARRRALRQRRL